MELALAIISIIVGLVSIVLAIVSMITTSRTEKRIIKIVKTIRKLIDGKDDESWKGEHIIWKNYYCYWYQLLWFLH